ncbi:MAG TPA: response regulator, partial [Vicinamibacteria bacterium]|nr:response regulator [Vicinamibacteria bacterium]
QLPSTPVEQEPPTRLLLVEDNTDYALVMRAALATTGRSFAIDHVERLEEALARLSRGGTDVILLDLALPDSTGTDTVRHVHEAAPEVPIVVLTGLTDDALAQQSIREGAQDYLVKGRVDGAMLGYAIGFGFMATLGQSIIDFYHAQHHWNRVVELYNGTWGIWFLAAAAFTPIPYKVATIAAGATHMAFAPFIVVSILGRGARFFLVAAILKVFGAPVRRTLEKNFDLAALAFLVLLVAGFAILKAL